MGALIIPVLIVIGIVVVAVLGVRHLARGERRHAEDLRTTDRSVRYRVPPGQDPAEVVSALRSWGYDAAPDSTGGTGPEVLIRLGSGGGPDREEVRQVLGNARPRNADGQPGDQQPPVRFLDEDEPR